MVSYEEDFGTNGSILIPYLIHSYCLLNGQDDETQISPLVLVIEKKELEQGVLAEDSIKSVLNMFIEGTDNEEP